MGRLLSACIFSLLFAIPMDSLAETKPISLEERARIRSEWNLKRVNQLLLPAMRKAGLDCWIIMSREFNKDFVLEYIEDNRENTPGGHRNAYIFFDDGSKLHKNPPGYSPSSGQQALGHDEVLPQRAR